MVTRRSPAVATSPGQDSSHQEHPSGVETGTQIPPGAFLGYLRGMRIIKRFRDFAVPDLPYMYHCHILKHEDAGMMGQGVVEES